MEQEPPIPGAVQQWVKEIHNSLQRTPLHQREAHVFRKHSQLGGSFFKRHHLQMKYYIVDPQKQWPLKVST